MKKITFFLTTLFLFSLANIFAENIVLKSGKSIEGKIIKKTDDAVLVDVGGVAINYYFDEIISISGKKVSSSKSLSADKGKLSGQSYVSAQDKTLSWQEWYKQVKGYLDKFDEISKKSQALAIEQNDKLEKAKNDARLQKEIILEGIRTLDALFSEFKALTPAPELKNFHDKLIESYGYVKEINEAALRDDNDSALAYNQAVNTLTLEAFTDLKNLYLKYGAPQEKIDSVNRVIAKCLETNEKE